MSIEVVRKKDEPYARLVQRNSVRFWSKWFLDFHSIDNNMDMNEDDMFIQPNDQLGYELSV